MQNAHFFEWDLATCTPRRRWSFSKNAFDMGLWTDSSGSRLVFAGSPNGKQAAIAIATLADDGTLEVTPRLFTDGQGAFMELALARDQQRFVAGGEDSHLHVWTRIGQNEWRKAQLLDTEGTAVRDITALDDSARWIAVCAEVLDSSGLNLSLQVWDLLAGRRISAPIEHSELLASRLALSGDGSQLAVGTFSGPILLFHVDRHSNSITFQPDGRLLGHTRYITALAFHPSERRLVSSAKDQGLKIWDLESRAEVATLHGHPANADCLVFDAAGEQLVSGSSGAFGSDNVVRLWGTHRLSDRDAAQRAAAMRAYHEARRHLAGRDPTAEACAEAACQVANDATLPADVRRFAAEELPERMVERTPTNKQH